MRLNHWKEKSGLTFPFNDLNALADLLKKHDNDIAALVIEPTGKVIPKPGFLTEVRRLCDHHGVVLVFDEVISGFRIDMGGAQACAPPISMRKPEITSSNTRTTPWWSHKRRTSVKKPGLGMTFPVGSITKAAMSLSCFLSKSASAFKSLKGKVRPDFSFQWFKRTGWFA